MNLLQKVDALEHEAADFGFQWETAEQIMDQIRSECDEIGEHLQAGVKSHSADLQEEIGDLLHAAFSLCVFCQFSPEETLKQTLNKFERRLRAVQAISSERQLESLKGQAFDDLMAIWKEAKHRVG